MEDLQSLSNEDLKYRLTQFGFANLPVTNTTRNVLIKKLRNHMENEKSKLRRETSYATRYSSDEDLTQSDKHKVTQKKRGSLGRTTIAAMPSARVKGVVSKTTMPPPLPTMHTTPAVKRNLSSLSASSSPASSLNRSSVYVSPLIQGASSDTDEESDSNTDTSYGRNSSSVGARASIGNASYGSFNGSDSAASNHHYSVYGTGLRKRFHGSDEGDATASQNSSPDASPKSTNGIHSGDDSTSNDFTKRLLSFRSRNMGGLNSSGPAAASVSHNTALNSAKRYNRYMPSMGVMPRPAYLNDSGRWPNMTRDSIVYQANTSHNQNGVGRKYAPPPVAPSLMTNLINKLDEQYGVRQSFVPCALLSTLIIFFVLVSVAYLTMSADLSQALDAKAATFKVCQPTSSRDFDEPGDDANRKTVNCIDESDLDAAFSLLKRLIPELQRQIVHNRCKDPAAAFGMSSREIIKLMVEDWTSSAFKTMHALHNAEYLVSVNPQWHVGNFADAYATAALTMDEVMILRESQTNHMAIVSPRLPLSCMLYKKMQAFFIIIGCLGILLAALYFIVFAYKKIMAHIRERRDRLNNLIEDITNVLMQKAYDPDTAATEAASVVINHLRDKLIPPAERSRMESTWNDAIKFFEHNESRVQFSVATRNGEDYRVMRWVDTSMPTSRQSSSLSPPTSPVAATASQSATASPSAYTTSSLYPRLSGPHGGPGLAGAPTASAAVKKWQSPAFDKTNKIKDPPTECLKVRQMFDKYEASNPNLKQTIQDAILEKLGHTTCRIYDIQLDKATCCVYVRCGSARDAGLVHDEINGWWFDSRLVSIKFLRLERFTARFPQSTSTVCLEPSNSKNLSMAICNDDSNGDDGNDDDDYNYNGSG